jgi:hypothetical protein
MLPPCWTASLELAVGVEIVRFQVAVNRLTSGPRGASTRSGLDDDEWRLVLLGNLGGRQPGLLQSRELAQQGLL